ncbi:MAG: LptF/LptG family permease [Paludibacteraceae bacterium]|jgi:lipopolysaccharide export system permease protein|nr:LptF/LptG family permease [Paludibacteraceae bacterium]MDI9537008.1 LptF/LptG family permease [Bacteroidota bacterium]HHT61569.1 YjgP/YjgQ family permease [Bacteroidales bacterium]MBP9039358.1 LptF/LptG family permease [Paludibacteraceae bacterium]HOA46748.1 LptF/LptG family permease [Paludibacteraceae bacterium]
MLGIKRIDSYLFKNFISLFFITFFICLFIVVMQFFWLHIDDLVGKGLGLGVLLELFLYASLSMIPLSLPLAILLASLMTFGNLGERFELLAMKSAGISLFRIMRSLFVFIFFICIGAFFFSNNVIPVVQMKMWTLMISVQQKSPELDIPIGEFYSGVNGLHFYVRGKDHKTKVLKDVMIYDFSNGFNNASVTTADSARIQLTADKKNLMLTLYNGESFENLKKQELGLRSKSIPYRRETFVKKEVLVDFDANFNRMDESMMQDQHISKDIVRLTNDIDSSLLVRDSLQQNFTREMVTTRYYHNVYEEEFELDELTPVFPDSLLLAMSQSDLKLTVNNALMTVKSTKNEVQYNHIIISDVDRYVIQHSVEWHRKFTLSFACLIFFFIGAPLGAIIRKGGLGMPVVVSVALFIIYYIIDTTGQKMAREGIWETWQGMWLSSAVLLPVGIFLTYKAATDSALFKSEAYAIFFNQVKEWIKNLKFFRKNAKE